MNPYGFVMTRHVTNEKHDQLWRMACRSIRQFYDYPIIIIDDYSDIEINDNDLPVNTTVVKSKYTKGCGELLPLLYLNTERWFECTVILHDSVQLIQPFHESIWTTSSVRYLWSFEEHEPYYRDITEHLLNFIGIDKEVYNKKEWQGYGCFGVMCIIHINFLSALINRYHLETLEPYITSRFLRMCFERVFSISCFLLLQGYTDPSLFGNIVTYMPYGLTYDMYMTSTDTWKHLPCIKIWSAR